MVEIARRGFITGLIALVAAPAIVRAGSLMPVKQILPRELSWADIVNVSLRNRADALGEMVTRNNALLRCLQGQAIAAAYPGLETVQTASFARLLANG